MRDSEIERRDVLQTLVAAVGLPADPVSIDTVNGDVDMPDVGDGDPFWILLYWASWRENIEEVEEDWLPIMSLFSSRGMDDGEMWSQLQSAARGEYDDEMLEQRASYAWGRHR